MTFHLHQSNTIVDIIPHLSIHYLHCAFNTKIGTIESRNENSQMSKDNWFSKQATNKRGSSSFRNNFISRVLKRSLMTSGTERCPQKGVVKLVASKLLRALSEKGLALLVNHGIPECKVQREKRGRRVCKTISDREASFD